MVDRVDHVANQLDNQLGLGVRRGSLGSEQHDAWRQVGLGLVEQAVIPHDHLQNVQQLSLVLVQALDLHVEQRVGRHFDGEPSLDPLGQPLLVSTLDGAKLLLKLGVIGVFLQLAQLPKVANPAVANALRDRSR